MDSLQKFQQAVLKIQDLATERTHYSGFCEFLRDFFAEAEISKNISANIEETSTQHEDKVGFPDITIRDGNRLVGWIEVKLLGDDIGSKKFERQFKKYRDSLENVIFTNFRQWELWQWDSNGKPEKVEELSFDVRSFSIGSEEKLQRFLWKFFEGQAYDARTPKQLALALAKKTKLLSQQVEENFTDEEEGGDLHKLKKTFSETLIQDISEHQFANMVAETLAYSLFLASLEFSRKEVASKLTLRTAIDFLPKNVPILKDMYDLVGRIASVFPTIRQAAESLVDQLNNAEIERIRAKLVEHKPGDDPVIQFYEPFLNEYDPKEREARGVYYTPKPVVDFIVRSVDHLLQTKFGKEDGLANEDVNILDPATGTGTFLMSAIQQVHYRIKKKYEANGEDIVRKKFNDIVLTHILKHFYGFELLVAPYAVAHLKLTLEIERLGFDFQSTYDDNDSANDRFQVFLANTLDNPNAPPKDLLGFESIAHESEQARHVKKNKPILAIIGNPPYSGISQNAVERIIENNNPKTGKTQRKKVKTWIGELIEHYKYTDEGHFNERKHWLGDDYVKFIRFTQWKIAQTGQGVIGMITNNGFLDNPTFRGMRYQLMQEFDEIYCLNLHGSTAKKETALDGSKDESVFNIQTGTSITFFVKKSQKQRCQIFYKDLYGVRSEKFKYLLERNFEDVQWEKLNPVAPYYFFMDKDFGGDGEYERFWGINDIFSVNVTGIVTARDAMVIDFEKKDLISRIEEFCDLSKTDDEIRSKFFGGKKSGKYLPGDSRGWKLPEARKQIAEEGHKKNIKNILYRPFDTRSIYYHPEMVDWGREKIMKNFLMGENLGMVISKANRQASLGYFFVTKEIVDFHILDNARDSTSLFPLYLYPETNQQNLLGETERTPNINPEFIREFSAKLGITLTSENIFYYAYAVFHCPTYRIRYAEQLKIDFPRLPLTSDKELFKNLVFKGNELVNLHLLGENPFDNSSTIFDDNSKWNVKTGGGKPANTEDWKVEEVEYKPTEKRVYVNSGQYFEGIEKEVWEFMIGGYQVLEKWLKDRKKAERCLSADDLLHYQKIVVSLRETIRVMKEIDELIPKWPMQ